MQRSGRLLKRLDCPNISIEGEQGEAFSKFLEDIAAGGQGLWSQMVPRLGCIGMVSINTARRIRRSKNNRRALVVGIV